MGRARNFMRNRSDRRPQRRAETQERLEVWQAMSPAEQLACLDGRLGKGVGAVKQRARIQALIDEKTKKVERPAEKPEKVEK